MIAANIIESAFHPLIWLFLQVLLGVHDVKLYDVSYASRAGGKLFEFSANLVTNSESGLQRLALRLKETSGLVEFSLAKLSR